MHRIAQQIHNHLKNAANLTLVAHQNPDGDTLGSAAAFAEYLQTIGKSVKIFCLSPVPDKFNFLRHVALISQDENILTQADTIITLDCGDLRYAGVAEITKDAATPIINIDHHATNEKYGHLNLVAPAASSTAEVVYDFFKANNIRITSGMACALLTGLLTDTENFSNSATAHSSLSAAGELLRLGANWALIHRCLAKTKSVNILKLWGLVLSRLNKKENTDMAYTYLTVQDMVQYGVSDEDMEGIANFLNKLDEAKILLFVKETADGKIKGSFRTVCDDVDVSLLAKQLGGGGHKKAAGFMCEGTIESIVNKIIDLSR